ncbi:MAG: GNAT family N-acetyltransferase [Dehalococcoidia bacterium]
MSEDYFLDALDLYRAGRAAELGCEPIDFDSHALTITARPPASTSKFLLMATTFGTGTVCSVAPDYLDWVKTNAPQTHYRILFPNVLLDPLVAEARARGESVSYRSPNLSFLPGSRPVALPLPRGFTGVRVGPDFREQHVQSGEFDNALGEPGDAYVASLWRYGFALFSGETPVAVAGAYRDYEGVSEIGIDVARSYRGIGLARVAVTNLAAILAAEGEVPSYYCAPTNVRSHRNALACGFLPVASMVRAMVVDS